MSKTDGITQARLKELLHYDPETGLLVWLQRPAHCIHIGDIAGCLNARGYIVIRIDGVLYRAHRLIFLYMLGWMPEQVDHDNHIRHDNRWINLNPSSDPKNRKNQTLSSKNTSGHCGVFWAKRREKWEVGIKINRKKIFLGYFDELSDAIAARKAAEVKHGFHVNHGKLSI